MAPTDEPATARMPPDTVPNSSPAATVSTAASGKDSRTAAA